MAQKFIRASFASVALFALVPLTTVAQAPLAPPPQIPYGLSISTESAKHAAAASIAEARNNHWKMAIAIFLSRWGPRRGLGARHVKRPSFFVWPRMAAREMCRLLGRRALILRDCGHMAMFSSWSQIIRALAHF
jgi:pimeloyl-ACP methyl ester carboxylesterase